MKKKKSNFIKNIKKTWIYIKDCKSSLVGYAFVNIIEAVLGAIIPIFSAKMILNVTSGAMEQLILSTIIVTVMDLILYGAYFFKGFWYQKIYQKTLVNLQAAVARETLKLEVEEMDKQTSGLFINRLNKDTEDISSMFMEYTYWISFVMSRIGILVTIFILNKYMFIYSAAVVVIIFLINRKRISKRYEIFRKLKKIQEKKTGLTSELVRGIRDIKVLNASKSALNKTTSKIVEASNTEVKMMNVNRIYYYVEQNTRTISDFIFILLGVLLFKNNLLTIPVFVILYNYQSKVKDLLTGVVQISEYNKKFVVASDRLYEIIDDGHFKKENFGNIKLKKLSGDIKFIDVNFKYDQNKKVINKMSFSIKPNEKVAFVGKSGAGKSTIFSLITRLYHIDSGKILLDGYDIEDLDENTIRNNMSMITQNPYIFNFSIKDNLLLAKQNATMKELREACKMACIDEFIMGLPDKYDTIIGENGIILSGGQRQRLAIARALLMKTEIILFDEATSALDNETQSEIQEAIENLTGEYTILIVAHRLSTVIDSDRIFVVNDGKIIDSGSHKELMKKCKFYRDLYEKDLQV